MASLRVKFIVDRITWIHHAKLEKTLSKNFVDSTDPISGLLWFQMINGAPQFLF